MLSDISKEYLYWDVSGQFYMLYVLTAFHIVIILWGTIVSSLPIKLLQNNMLNGKSIYVFLHQVGNVCGLIGIACIYWEYFMVSYRSSIDYS